MNIFYLQDISYVSIFDFEHVKCLLGWRRKFEPVGDYCQFKKIKLDVINNTVTLKLQKTRN